jgi:hypothetical protein
MANRATLSFGTNNGSGPRTASAQHSIVEGHLHHVVVTREDDQGMVFVFDAADEAMGHVAAGNSVLWEVGSSALAFSVGSDFTGGDCNDQFFFDGTIDDLRVYSGARQPEVFKADFLGPVDCQADPGALLAYWPFDDLAADGGLEHSCAGVTLDVPGAAVTLEDFAVRHVSSPLSTVGADSHKRRSSRCSLSRNRAARSLAARRRGQRPPPRRARCPPGP